jgi:hypothetical protein
MDGQRAEGSESGSIHLAGGQETSVERRAQAGRRNRRATDLQTDCDHLNKSHILNDIRQDLANGHVAGRWLGLSREAGWQSPWQRAITARTVTCHPLIHKGLRSHP